MEEKSHVKRNFALNAVDGITFFLGMFFLSQENIIPVYMDELGASSFWISLIPALKNIGAFFPSIFVARRIQGFVRQKPWLVQIGLIQRIPWGLSGLLCFIWAGQYPRMAVASLLIAVFLVNLGSGMSLPSYLYYTAKTIPVTMRGRLFALRNLLSYLIGFFCGASIKLLLETVPSPRNYAVLMLIGFAILMIYLPVFHYMIEPDGKEVKDPRLQNRKDFCRSLVLLLRENKNLRRYIIGRVFYTLAYASINYYAVYIMKKYDLPGSTVGLFTVLTAATFLVANPLLGLIADKKGHLFNHYIAAAALVVSTGVIVFSDSYMISLSTIILGALVLCIQSVSTQALPMEFGEEHEIPVYMGLVGLFVGGASLLIIVFAMMARTWGYRPVFLICLVCSLCSLFFFARMKEPRRHVKRIIKDAV